MLSITLPPLLTTLALLLATMTMLLLTLHKLSLTLPKLSITMALLLSTAVFFSTMNKKIAKYIILFLLFSIDYLKNIYFCSINFKQTIK